VAVLTETELIAPAAVANRGKARPRLFIADPGLAGLGGHHLAYSSAVAAAALKRGLEVVVLTSRNFGGSLGDPHIILRPVFNARYQTSGGGGTARAAIFGVASYLPGPVAELVAPPLRTLRRRLRGGKADEMADELDAALVEFEPNPRDQVLLHSVSGANLGSLLHGADFGGARLLIVLRRMPEEMEADDPAPESLVRLFDRIRRRFASRLGLFADTEELAAQYSALLRQPVRPVPVPVIVPPMPTLPLGPLPHVVFAGGARLEKGYHHLPPAIGATMERARFTVHSGRVDATADPLVQRAHRELRGLRGERLTLIEQPLAPSEYAALLASADLLLLPYDPLSYSARSSGIVAEAFALGVPAVVPGGCWMERVAGTDRAVIIGADGVVAALEAALDRLPELRAAARAAAPGWRERHNPDALLTVLLAAV
jgi:glycosyltransferase involved in cell wall biosynthesis